MKYEELKQKQKNLIEKNRYLKKKLANYSNLLHRSECPCCEQKINWEEYQQKIPDIESRLKKIDNQLDDIIPLIMEFDRKKNLEEYVKYKIHKVLIDDYIKEHRNILNKAIRDYNNGVDKYLPDIPDIEKETWNEAMEWYLDNRNMDENDELYFEINK